MEKLFLEIVNMSISAGWLVLAILPLRLLLKRAPRWAFCALWGLVALRLMLPISLESALSLVPSAETIPPEIVYEARPEIHSGVPALNQAVNPVISESFAPAPGASANPLQIWSAIAANLWLLGVAAMLLYAVVSYWRLKARVREATLLRENIRQCAAVDSPFVLGLFRPLIYLPYDMGEEDAEQVITHEQAHIARRDYLIKPLGFLLLSVYWFHPLMWLAYVLLARDIEVACDQRVVKGLDMEQRRAYSRALLNCSVNRARIAACPLAFGEVSVKDRVKGVMNYKKPGFWIILASALAVAVAAVCFLTNPKEQDLSFLNYKTSVALAGQQESVQAIYYPVTEDGSGSIVIGRAGGRELAEYLELAHWRERNRPSGNLPSPGSVQFIIEEELRITVFEQPRLARVQAGAETRYYRTGSTDYERAVDLVYGNLPFEQQYAVAELLYAAPQYSFTYTLENAPWYYLSADGGLNVLEDKDSGNWLHPGIFSTEITLNEENFDKYFERNGSGDWMGWRETARTLREGNRGAWRLIVGEELGLPLLKNSAMYYLLQQEDGSVYLAQGYYNIPSWEPYLQDESNIRWLFRLAPTTGGVTRGSFAFEGLLPGETAISDAVAVFEGEGGRVDITANFAPTGLDLEIGLIYQNGDKHAMYGVGGSFEGEALIPAAGQYRVYAKNLEHNRQHGMEEAGLAVSGVVTFQALGGYLMDEAEEAEGATVHSGPNAAALTAFDPAADLNDIRSGVNWLVIDPYETESVPFRTFLDGEEQYGWLNVYDAETLEPLEFFHPSGLAPQTYAFQNARPGHAYIVTLLAGEEQGNLLYCFGALLPGEDGALHGIADGMIPYRSSHCVYISPASSAAIVTGDNGLSYLFGENSLCITNRNSGDIVFMRSLLDWQWTPLEELDWRWLKDVMQGDEAYAGLKRRMEGFHTALGVELGEGHYLLSMDDELWIAEARGPEAVRELLWSIYAIAPVGGGSQAKEAARQDAAWAEGDLDGDGLMDTAEIYAIPADIYEATVEYGLDMENTHPARVDVWLGNGQPAKLYIGGSWMGPGITASDLDGDGKDELIVFLEVFGSNYGASHVAVYRMEDGIVRPCGDPVEAALGQMDTLLKSVDGSFTKGYGDCIGGGVIQGEDGPLLRLKFLKDYDPGAGISTAWYVDMQYYGRGWQAVSIQMGEAYGEYVPLDYDVSAALNEWSRGRRVLKSYAKSGKEAALELAGGIVFDPGGMEPVNGGNVYRIPGYGYDLLEVSLWQGRVTYEGMPVLTDNDGPEGELLLRNGVQYEDGGDWIDGLTGWLVSETIMERRDGAVYLHTAYYLQNPADTKQPLVFRFHNAMERDGEWQLAMNEQDCIQLLETLRFTG